MENATIETLDATMGALEEQMQKAQDSKTVAIFLIKSICVMFILAVIFIIYLECFHFISFLIFAIVLTPYIIWMISDNKKIRKITEQKKYAVELKTKKLKVYARLFGASKTKAMFLDKIVELESSIPQISQAAVEEICQCSRQMDSALQCELNPTIVGGVVNGFAGPVAGIAAALDTQQRNIKVRQDNAKIAELTRQLNQYTVQEAASERGLAKRQIAWFERGVKRTETQWVLEKPQDELFSLLSFTGISYRRYPNINVIQMAIRITRQEVVDPRVSSRTRINSRKCYVDGSFKAVFTSKGVKVGEVICVLPYDTGGSETLYAICPVENPEECKVTFESYGPRGLWLTEEIRHVPWSHNTFKKYEEREGTDFCAFYRYDK